MPEPVGHKDRTVVIGRRCLKCIRTLTLPSPTTGDCRKIASPASADVSADANRERPPRDLLLQVTRRVRVQAVISIPSAGDCPSVPVTCVILEATGDPHPDPLPGQGEGIRKDPWHSCICTAFALQKHLSTVSRVGETLCITLSHISLWERAG